MMLFERLRSVLLVALSLGLICCHSNGAKASFRHSRYGDVNGGTNCAACSLIVSLSEQISEIHNGTIVKGLQRICSYLPEKFQETCNEFLELATPILIDMAFDDYITPDVACHLLNFCWTESGQQTCHLYPLPKVGMDRLVQKVRRRLPPIYRTRNRFGSDPDCAALPVFKELCEVIVKRFGDNHLPLIDVDYDRYSVTKTLRGSYWRGKDCDDISSGVYPGTKAKHEDVGSDSDCNGIFGIDPQTNRSYEKMLCGATPRMGTAILGDSAGAHFHIPKEWLTATEISADAFKDLLMIIENEMDWPMTSATTGFMNSTWSVLSGPTDSLYLRLRGLNHCNHRDFQSIAVNGADTGNMNSSVQYGFARDQGGDHPLMLLYSLIGNDVCNGHNDTIAHMTSPAQARANFLDTLKYLDTRLPAGSHVIVSGMADGRVLYETLKNRIHPIGQWRHDITYPDIYNYLSCLQVSPCNGWMSSNATLRNLTSQRAVNISKELKDVCENYKAKNFKLYFFDFDIREVIKMWEARGGQAWQLIEPVDGFHPSQISMALSAEMIWKDLENAMPDVLKMLSNPNNNLIHTIFGDQGGY